MSASNPPASSDSSNSSTFIGLMSGTSLDGVDGVLAVFASGAGRPAHTLAHVHLPFSDELRAQLMSLQAPSDNEIDLEALTANGLATRYAQCVRQLLDQCGLSASAVAAVGVHGQTIRHRPELGYTRQTNNPALLAELCGIDVIADFRSRDIAAGGQGAPLVPAFHKAFFGSDEECRVVVNIGGIANISLLRPGSEAIIGFDTGPGNALMDLWIARHRQLGYDDQGSWAASGKLLEPLLARMLAEPYFQLPPPKSTGRDLFHALWLQTRLAEQAHADPADVQRTLCELTACSIANAIADLAPDAKRVFVCGGGAFNGFLLERLATRLQQRGLGIAVETTAVLGVPPTEVESLAFAWLARQFMQRQAGNLPSVTGARGPRILGALYPA
jgi:anhydro-N-acetylmuramic acid kinase